LLKTGLKINSMNNSIQFHIIGIQFAGTLAIE